MASKKKSNKILTEKTHAYSKAGVNIFEGDRFVSLIAPFVKNTQKSLRGKSVGVRKVPSGYAGLYQISRDQYLAATTDGVGTKLKLAFDLNLHDTVGIDLVAMSVNDLICVGAKPILFLDYFATGKLKANQAAAVVKGIALGCLEAGAALVGGETAEMPGFYAPGEYDLAGFAVGLVDKKNLLNGEGVKTGDVLIGIPSSGFHSNGYSLLRKIFRTASRSQKKKLLAPTRIYVSLVQDVLKRFGKNKVKAMAHVTGSGFLNIPRINEGFDYEIEFDETGLPPLFKEAMRRGKLSFEEMFTTFNMGIGLVLCVDVSASAQVLRYLKLKREKPVWLGKVGKPKSKGRNLKINIGLKKGQSLSFNY